MELMLHSTKHAQDRGACWGRTWHEYEECKTRIKCTVIPQPCVVAGGLAGSQAGKGKQSRKERTRSKVYYSATGEPGVKGTVAKVVSEGSCNASCHATPWVVLLMYPDVA